MKLRIAIVFHIYFDFRRVAKGFDDQILEKPKMAASAILNFKQLQ